MVFAPVIYVQIYYPVIHVITWITTHLPTMEGCKTELAWLVDP